MPLFRGFREQTSTAPKVTDVALVVRDPINEDIAASLNDILRELKQMNHHLSLLTEFEDYV